MPASFVTRMRSHSCGALRLEHVGSLVRLGGWVHRRRDLGGLVFLDLRDRSGIVQISCNPDSAPAEVMLAAASAGAETVLLIEGEVVARPLEMRNPDLPSGDVEVRATGVNVVGPATTPAIPVARAKGEPLPAEEQRLRHRHLDLRRPELQGNLILRHRLMQETRRYFDALGFLEIETPILTKPTPEGARDFLVPSRVHAGEFYALPQSPQLYKQLLMVSGYDRYFQIARCFRDEDLRADRQPEFTQIDVEASFITPDDILDLTEGLLQALWKEGGVQVDRPFRRMTYDDAMERYGTDRPDLRYALEIQDATELFRGSEFTIARSAIEKGGRVRGIRIPGGGVFSRKQVDELESIARSAGAGGLLRLKRVQGALEGPVARFVSEQAATTLGLQDGDLCLMVAAPDRISSTALDRVRQEVARRLDLIPPDANEFLWVTDFPAFERDADSGALTFVHHPFTAPHPDDVPLLDIAPERSRALAYDVVLNGMELGGGSIRISDPRLQERVFALLGLDAETAESRFSFLLEGLRAGAPPHGGIALGMDRLAMLLAGATSLRDVIAFPKTTAARALFEGAPTVVSDRDLRDLHIAIREEAVP
ncbi:MAG TPA: aspartate--tRNA ligase [Gemmatimonadaceae bacterium]|nr:aspartate--tRNA ligase [Gemmatimonadaceae bacterium]